uniref:Heat shock protein 70 n=1 Tax=Panagrolaimus davidi TaxID=227884 RepID=A0A914Q0S2_9BILA
MYQPKAVGIDLGTTYSCVGIFRYGKCEILQNGLQERTTPSVVGFIKGQTVVGQAAKDKMRRFPKNVISCAKRLIGRKFNDPNVQNDMKILPFKIVEKDGNAAVEVQIENETKIYTPEAISAMVLLDLKKTALNFLGGFETDTVGAVITIPAYFSDSQRQATKDAARIAGLNVLAIINEPTAAALAYGYKQNWKEGILLVYDLGGGTFDVSIIKVTNGCCEVLAVGGDDHLGGEDFDNVLVNEIKRYYGSHISDNARDLCRLKAACEKAKIELSNSEFASIEIEKFLEGDDLCWKFTQSDFNELCKDLVEKTLGHVQKALEKAKITKNDVNKVLLVGGSTRIPCIGKALSELFDQKTIFSNIDPDEAVAHGAAIWAAHLSKTFDTSIQNIRLLDVIPRSLGIKINDGSFSVIIERYTKFPCKVTKGYQTAVDNQTGAVFIVYEGEEPVAENNKLLGKFTLTNVAPAPAGEAKFDLTYNVDENCILTATAVDRQNGNLSSHQILPDKGRLSESQIVQMIDEICPKPLKIDLTDV